jgi:hypothetical protein
MLIRSLKSLSHSFKPLSTSVIRPQASFATEEAWKPNIPNFNIFIEKTGYHFAHPTWNLKSAENVQLTHYEPKDFRDRLALTLVRIMRKIFDTLSRYDPGRADERMYLTRFIFLESLSGVPGMVGGMIRHMRSLGHLRHDRGRIHYLLKEAENQRVHLFTFLDLKHPGIMFRLAILTAQAMHIVCYAALYTISQKTAHRFVGYMKEQSIKNYTDCIDDLAVGKLPGWADVEVPKRARQYWALDKDAKMRDVLLCIRADETLHREMNHRFASLRPDQEMEYLGRMSTEAKIIEQAK